MILDILFYTSSLLILLLVFLLYKLVIGSWFEGYFAKKKYGDKVEVVWFPGLGAFHFIQQSVKQHKDALKYMSLLREKNPNAKALYSTGLKGKVFWAIWDPELQKQLLQNPQNYEKSSQIIFLQRKYLSKGLFFTEDYKSWKIQREMLSEAFHFQSLKSYTPVINKYTTEQARQIQVGVPDKIVTTCSVIAGKVVAATFFGEDFYKIKLNGKSVIEEIQSVGSEGGEIARSKSFLVKFGIIKRLVEKPFFQSEREKKYAKRVESLFDYLTTYIQGRIDNRKSKNENKKSNFFEIMLEQYDQGKITIQQINENFFSFFFAGIDTTGNYTAMSFYCLAKLQDVQQRLYEEIVKYFKETRENFDKNQDFEIYHEDLNKIEVLNNFIKEAFRFYNPAPGLLFRVINKDHKLGELELKKGQLMTINTRINMLSEKYFENADQFNLDRWSDQKSKKIDPYAFIPFGSGPRNCLGQHLSLIEIKIMLIKFLLKYKVELNPKTEFVLSPGIVFASKYEDLVIFENRN